MIDRQLRIYIDANAFIAAVEGWDSGGVDLHDSLWRLFDEGGKRGDLLFTSELSLAEVLVKPLEDGRSTLAATYLDLIQNGSALTVAPVSRSVLILAAHIRKERKSVKLPDAIHLATAEQEKCTAILTNDLRLTSETAQRISLSSATISNLLGEAF